jgi:arginine exporter protein ArgO
MYMHNEFIPQYKNNITAVAFMGTAFLILNIGLRGVMFMVAHEPTLIIIAILVEMIVLILLGLTTWYEKSLDGKKEEETGLNLDKGLLLEKIDDFRNDVANS